MPGDPVATIADARPAGQAHRLIASVRDSLVAFVWGLGEHCADILGLNDVYFNASVVGYLESLEAEERAFKVQRKARRLERMREEEDLVALEEVGPHGTEHTPPMSEGGDRLIN